MDNQNQHIQTPNQKLSVNSNSSESKVIPIALGVVAVTIIVIGSFILGTKQNRSLVQPKENFALCTNAANYSNEFYVTFKGGVSRQTAERILKENNVKDFNLTSLPPDEYRFKLDESRMCESLKRLYDEKDIFKIPVIYLYPNEVDPSNAYSYCPSIPNSFVVQNGKMKPSNAFLLTFYQNKEKLGGLLKEIGAFDISGGPKSETEKVKTYYVTFPEGQACQNFEKIKKNNNVTSAGDVPDMPTVH